MKRYLIELGMGVDLHGGDVTKATKRALKDAISHCCMCGLQEIVKPKGVLLKIKVACPTPEKVDTEALKEVLPFGQIEFEEIVEGGLSTQGLHVESFGAGDQIVVSLVSITVFVD